MADGYSITMLRLDDIDKYEKHQAMNACLSSEHLQK